MARNSESDLAALRAVQAAALSGDRKGAAVLCEQALADGLEHPLLLNLLALKHESEGRISEAEKLLTRAVRRYPTDIGSLNALGLCLLRLERPGEALHHFDALLRLDNTLAFVHTNRGNSLRELGRVLEAEASYRHALHLEPNHAVAQAGLANIASRRGAYPAARMWAERALAGLPQLADASMSLATAELGQGEPVQAEARIRLLLSREQLVPIHTAYSRGLLGDILDAQGRIEEAFAAYTACNTDLQRIYSGRFEGVDSALQYLLAMIRYFQGVKPGFLRPSTPSQARLGEVAGHVFVLGFPRSGTTLLEVILEGHPNVSSLEENESLIDSVRKFMRKPEDLELLANADSAALDECRVDYWRRVAEAGVDVAGRVFVDKNPLNTLKLPLIWRLFPDAKVIFACRDPRDVVLSCFRHRFQMSAPMYEFLTINGAAAYYNAVMQLVVLYINAMPFNLCLVRHEDLVTEFMREMKRVCAFLNLEWDKGMGDFALRAKNRSILTPSTAQLVRGLNTEGVGQWRRYRAQMTPILHIIEPWVKRFYYDP